MAYRYSLYPTSITGGQDDHIARSNDNDSMELEEVIRRITIPGSILKETECRAVIDAFFRIVGDNLAEGIGLKSEYLQIQPGLGGVFNDSNDVFDPDRHRKQVKIKAGNTLRKAVTLMPIEKVSPAQTAPKPKGVFDMKTQTSDKLITPGNVLNIKGQLLQYNPERDDEGAFFINRKSNKVYRSAFASVNKPSQLLILIPEDLPGGSYYLEVRARIRRSKMLTKGRLDGALKVK